MYDRDDEERPPYDDGYGEKPDPWREAVLSELRGLRSVATLGTFCAVIAVFLLAFLLLLAAAPRHAHGAPAPLPKRAKVDPAHPEWLCGHWRLLIEGRKPLRRDSMGWAVELCADGTVRDSRHALGDWECVNGRLWIFDRRRPATYEAPAGVRGDRAIGGALADPLRAGLDPEMTWTLYLCRTEE